MSFVADVEAAVTAGVMCVPPVQDALAAVAADVVGVSPEEDAVAASAAAVVGVSPEEDAVAASSADVVAAALSGSWTPAVAGGGEIGDWLGVGGEGLLSKPGTGTSIFMILEVPEASC